MLASSMASRPQVRDPGIDFVRGLAILVILVDHIDTQRTLVGFAIIRCRLSARQMLSRSLSFCRDLCVVAFTVECSAKTGSGCAKRSHCVASQLYACQVAGYVITAAVIVGLLSSHKEFIIWMGLTESANSPVAATIYAVLLVYQPLFFDILPLYIVLLMVLPAMLAATRSGAGRPLPLALAWPSMPTRCIRPILIFPPPCKCLRSGRLAPQSIFLASAVLGCHYMQ